MKGRVTMIKRRNKTFIIKKEDSGKRLDIYLTEKEHGLSRSYIQKLIANNLVKVNSTPVRANYKLRFNDIITIEIPPPREINILPEKIFLDIYYEDSDIIIVNKPRGMATHPAEGNWQGTLVNALLYHYTHLSGINGKARPGIVHRLDKDTSGLLMIAKNDEAHINLAHQLKNREVVRRYMALVHGKLKNKNGIVNAPIGRHPVDRKKMAVVKQNSKEAVTHYKVINTSQNYSLVDVRLETGRTHQIRVHMAFINHPLVGDTKYGPAKAHFELDGQFLHAYRLGFVHPRKGNYIEFNAPLPDALSSVLKNIAIDVPIVTDSTI